MKALARTYSSVFSNRRELLDASLEQSRKRRCLHVAEEMESSQLLFKPPLWRQRRELIKQFLYQQQPNAVLDLGCGEGALLSFLVPTSDFPLTRIVGVEPNPSRIGIAAERCQPLKMDFQYLRENPLKVELYQESLENINESLIGIDAIVCTEVIEHLYPSMLLQFPGVTLGIYHPRIMIVSTPNAEFNVNFPNLKYGTTESVFRHSDHKFEWTRNEFEKWCTSIAQRYGYSVIFSGVGTLNNDHSHGYCTQMAVFTAIQWAPPSSAHVHRVYEPFAYFEYPYFQDQVGSDEEILQEVLGEVSYVCPISVALPYQIDFEMFWRCLRIRQLCKTKTRLFEVFLSSDKFRVESEEKVLVLEDPRPVLCDTEPNVEMEVVYGGLESYEEKASYDWNVSWKLGDIIDHDTWSVNEISEISW
ncbi:hypothetical protein K7432_009951 [Basidiobolus ranarum]|uniref:Small RNA 2'-O-methyltransferase n=1 Tax=Basidiobolus ranarum TaxID=34480 RepID=A0ABR2VWA5_9FUNG